MVRISVQRFAEFARGRIRRAGMTSTIPDTKFHLPMAPKAIYFEKGLRFDFI